MNKKIIILASAAWIALSAFVFAKAFFYIRDLQNTQGVSEAISKKAADDLVDDLRESFDRPYKEDIYGGKTPEQTWDLLIKALEAGDLDLASKYFIVDNQKYNLEFFKDVKNKGKLDRLIVDYKDGIEMRRYSGDLAFLNDPDVGLKYYNYADGEVVFVLNEFTGVWKIRTL